MYLKCYKENKDMKHINIFLKMVIYCQKYSYMVTWLELFEVKLALHFIGIKSYK